MKTVALKRLVLFCAVAALVAAAARGFASYGMRQIVYASPEQAEWMMTPQLLAQQQKLFDEEHIDVRIDYVVTGKKAMSALRQGLANFSSVGSLPLVTTTQAKDDLLILGRAMQSDAMYHLFTAREHVDDWTRYPIGVARGTAGELYLLAHLRRIGKLDEYKSHRLTLVETQTPESALANLADGTVKTTVLVNPISLIDSARELPGGDFVDMTTVDIFQTHMFYVTTTDHWKRNRAGVLAMMSAIKRASNEVVRNPEASFLAVAPLLKQTSLGDVSSLKVFKPDFTLVTDKASIQGSLTRDAELCLQAGLIARIPQFDVMLSVVDDVDQHLKSRGL